MKIVCIDPAQMSYDNFQLSPTAPPNTGGGGCLWASPPSHYEFRVQNCMYRLCYTYAEPFRDLGKSSREVSSPFVTNFEVEMGRINGTSIVLQLFLWSSGFYRDIGVSSIEVSDF